MKNIIVTGAKGFIGSIVCSRLASGNNVIGVDKASAASQKSFVYEQADFIEFLKENKLAADAPQYDSSYLRGRHGHMGRRKGKNTGVDILNICDEKAYKFSEIIQVVKNSGIRPNRPVISVPLTLVWIFTHMAGILFIKKRKWLHSCYEKFASSLVFDNKKMLNTGFKLRHSLETIFQSADPPAIAYNNSVSDR